MATVLPYSAKIQAEIDEDLLHYWHNATPADFTDSTTFRTVRAVNYKNEPKCIVK